MNWIENANILKDKKYFNNVYLNKTEKVIMFFNSIAYSQKLIYSYSDLQYKKRDDRNDNKNFIFFLKSDKKSLILKLKGTDDEIENCKNEFMENDFFLPKLINKNDLLKERCNSNLEISRLKQNLEAQKFNFVSKKTNQNKNELSPKIKISSPKTNFLILNKFQKDKKIEENLNFEIEKNLVDSFLINSDFSSKKSDSFRKYDIDEKRKGFYSGSNFMNSGISSIEFNSKKKGNLILREQSPVGLRPRIIKENNKNEYEKSHFQNKDIIFENSNFEVENKNLDVENEIKNLVEDKNNKKKKKKKNIFKKFCNLFKKKKKKLKNVIISKDLDSNIYLRENCIRKISEFFKVPEKFKLKKINLSKDYDNIIDTHIKFKNEKIILKKEKIKKDYIVFSNVTGFTPIIDDLKKIKGLKKISDFKMKINSLDYSKFANFSKKNTKSSLNNSSEKNDSELKKKNKFNFLENEDRNFQFFSENNFNLTFLNKEDYPFRKENKNCSLINIEKYKIISNKKENITTNILKNHKSHNILKNNQNKKIENVYQKNKNMFLKHKKDKISNQNKEKNKKYSENNNKKKYSENNNKKKYSENNNKKKYSENNNKKISENKNKDKNSCLKIPNKKIELISENKNKDKNSCLKIPNKKIELISENKNKDKNSCLKIPNKKIELISENKNKDKNSCLKIPNKKIELISENLKKEKKEIVINKKSTDALIKMNRKIGRKLLKLYSKKEVNIIFQNFCEKEEKKELLEIKGFCFIEKFKKFCNIILEENFDLNLYMNFLEIFDEILKNSVLELKNLVKKYFTYFNNTLKINKFYVFNLQLFINEFEILKNDLFEIYFHLFDLSNQFPKKKLSFFFNSQKSIIEVFYRINNFDIEEIEFIGPTNYRNVFKKKLLKVTNNILKDTSALKEILKIGLLDAKDLIN